MDSTILGSIIGALAAMVAASFPFLIQRFGKHKQLRKFVYIKVLHLTKKEEGRSPVYRKFIKRLEKEIGIWDEFQYFRFNVFSCPQKTFTTTDRSSGAVDLQLLYPWHESLTFSDKDAQYVENMVSQTNDRKSSIYFTETKYYNGLQPGHEDLGMKMEHRTKRARLVLDFSSLPLKDQILAEPPKGYFRSGDREEQVGVTEPSPGVFAISKSDMKKDEVLRLDFKINWEAAVCHC